MKIFLSLAFPMLFALLAACGSSSGEATADDRMMTRDDADAEFTSFNDSIPYFVNTSGDTIRKVIKSSTQWKKELTDMEYYVLRKAGTERAGTGDLLNNKKEGVYTCAACGLELFNSKTKYESGTGWPSFWQPIDDTHVLDVADNSYGMTRTENVCARCGSHLGHVFTDGPQPTGLRYCMNSVSLDFEAREMPDVKGAKKADDNKDKE